jgi:hypothetical protein
VPLTASLVENVSDTSLRRNETSLWYDLLHQMVHEGLERDIISEDGLRIGGTNTTIGACCMGRRWIELRQEKSGLRPSRIANNEAWEREPVCDKILHLLGWIPSNRVISKRTLASSFGCSSKAAKFS